MTQETQTGTLYQSRGVRWEEGSKGRGYMYTYGWFMLRFDRKQQNSVKQLSFNKKINKLKKKAEILFHQQSLSSQSYGFSSSHVWMRELDYKESWVPKNWYFWTVVLEKTFESPLDCMEIQSLHPKGNQFWIFIGRTDAEAETPILRPPDAKNHLIRKDPDAEKDWRWGEGDNRGWDGWMASRTQWTWVWARSGSWWRTGKPGVLESMGLQSWTQLSDWNDLSKRSQKFPLGIAS